VFLSRHTSVFSADNPTSHTDGTEKMTVPTTMHGIWLTGHGGLDQLQVRHDIPVPVPGSHDVLIKVGAAGVNNTDVNTRTAWYSKQESSSADASWSGAPLQFPRIQGADVCGRIVAVGSEVNVRRMGERVLVEPCLREANGQALEKPWYIGSECDGGFAEYTVVAARHAIHINSAFSDVELASFPCSYSTAENMLTRTHVESGDIVLITGASGGVGSAAIQLAKARGATVLAVTSANKSAGLKKLGADQTLDRDAPLNEVLGRDSVDVVLDVVAGPYWSSLLDILRPGGRYGVSGAIGGPLVELDVRTLYLKDLSFYGCTVLEPDVFANLVKRIENGDVSPLVAESYALDRIADAQTAFLEKKHIGKIVLVVGSQT
jgi:NADPH:quinone reductase-like Zn-dependent oxidoreductase